MPNKKAREKKEMEHEEAPSGFVTLYNYKEPFMRYEKGYGFWGVLLFDGKTEKVQCHLCGEWMQYIGNHLHKEHNMTAADYKRKVGLRQNTALISERLREKLIAASMEKRKANLVPGGKKTPEMIEKIRKTLKDTRAESQNDKGTCPLQLVDRLRKLHDKLGRTPHTDEIGFYQTLVKVWGSLQDACIAAGIPYRKPGQNIKHHTLGVKELYSKDQLVILMRSFREKHGREPSPSDARRNLLPAYNTYKNKFGSWKKAKQLAFTQ